MKNIIRIAFILTMLFNSNLVFAQFAVSEGLVSMDSKSSISLDLKGMDIVEVLKTLASKGDMNIVVASNVRGRVTMFLKDVNIKDAFEIILLANDLASDRRGDIIYVMTQKDYEELYGRRYGDKKEVKILQLKYAKAAEVGKALNQIKTKIGKVIIDEASNTIVFIDAPYAVLQTIELVEKIDKPTTTKIFQLNYAKVADIKDKVKEMLTSGVGTVQIDERTNKIVVTDLKDKVDEVEKVVGAFDDKLQQVLIEAKIVEITLKDKYKLGVDWEAVIKKLEENINIKSGFKLATQGTFIPGGELLIGNFGTGDYAAMIQALKTIGDVNTLSSPRITVLNNEEAKILIGSSEPYATNVVTQGTSTTTTATELTFLEIGVKLYVTPTINRHGFVSMKIKPEVSSKSGTYTYGSPETTVPIVSTTEAETSVTVKNGTTIIIAGLIKDNRSDTVDKVPILGDIPVLGMAFKRADKEIEKKELVIFITPHILSGEVDYIESPTTHPMKKEIFTEPEKPTFERRTPQRMDPSYFKKERAKKEAVKISPDLRASSSEEYFYIVTNKIMNTLSVPEDDTHIRKGDRVKVLFSLYSGGNLASKPKVIESTNNYLSVLTVEAIEKAAPFMPFPIAIQEIRKEFSLDIVYEPDAEKRGRLLWRR